MNHQTTERSIQNAMRGMRQLAERGGIYDGNRAVLDVLDWHEEMLDVERERIATAIANDPR